MTDSKKNKHTLKHNLEYVFLYLLYIFIYSSVINGLLALTCHFIGVKIPYENLNVIFNNVTLINRSLFSLLIFSLLLIPLIEELTFRLQLVKKSNINISVFAGVLFFGYSLFSSNKLLSIVLIIYLSIIVILHVKKTKMKSKFFPYLFWVVVFFSCLSQLRFIIIFENENWPLYLMFFTIMSIKAFYLAKIAKENGVYYSFGLNVIFYVLPTINYISNYH